MSVILSNDALLPVLRDIMLVVGISHGGAIYTTQTGKCHKSELTFSESHLLNT